MQAQEVEAGMLSIGVRCEAITAGGVSRALVEERSIVRIWAMRGTLHFVAADDLAWMLPLFGPRFIRGGRKRRLDLGLDEATGERGVRLLRDLLGERGPLMKAEIAEALSAKGIPMAGQASIHLIGLAAMQGWVCYGPLRGKKGSFVLIEDWLGKPLETSVENGIEELARRYLAAFAPATVEDFASWAGLSIRDCRTAWEIIASDLFEVKMGNSTVWMLLTQLDMLEDKMANRLVVNLLPRYDTYLLGYTDRSLIIDPEHVKRIYPGGGLIHPALLVDGKVAGTWRTDRKRGKVEVEVELFEHLSASVQNELEAEIKAVSHFLSQD